MSDEEADAHVKHESVGTDNGPTEGSTGGGQDGDPHQKSRRPTVVSRPPSSHLPRVDEEPTTTGGKSRNPRVETVDRGVGPTPLPPPHVEHPRFSPYVGLHSYIDPRNGLVDNPYVSGLTFPYCPVPYPVNQPLPINSHTLEGRYHWPPPGHLHQPMPGLAVSPSHSDVSSLLSMRSPHVGAAESVTALASRIHWEQLQRNFYQSPFSGRRYSPAGLPGFPVPPGSIYGEYPGHLSYSGRSLLSDIPPTPGSGSITLPGSLESSRLTSPRPSVVGKSRKRALSHSPISDYLDIQSLTRSSEGSLQLTPFLHNSRSSSAASGSYGHLSAASLGGVSPAHQQLQPNPYFRPAGSIPGSPFFYPMMPPMMGRHSGNTVLPPTSQHLQPPKIEPQPQITTTTKDAGSSVVSSTMDSTLEVKRSKIKKEHENSNLEGEEYDEDDDEKANGEGSGRDGHIPVEGEPDFVETNCHWENCSREHDTQDELVKHINQDHIQANKKAFVCRWIECSREEKPFKAQYMLVVHMRRHTGEKPHRCTFEGCLKAYSRLENLKTHLRSHTGEKPYMCEFPGCTKAFSNASDRAKHQNRTHSNAKPYVCKASGCTKRYTDPSSLRKHVKTVHGPDFYANKKHKGNEHPVSCKQEKKEDHDQDKNDNRDDEDSRKVEECLTVTPLQASISGERRKSQDNMGTVSQNHPSPQSSPEVNVTNNQQPGITEDHSQTTIITIGGEVLPEEEVDIPEPDEDEVPDQGSLVTRTNRLNARNMPNRLLKGRIINQDTLSGLPHLPGPNSPGSRSGTQAPSLTELTSKSSSVKNPLNKRMQDITVRNELQQSGQLLPGSRRDSNTSTISSYMSSMRSDASPFPLASLGSQFSSRRSSEASQISTRLSITNSPYEYDITGNLPHHGNTFSRRSSEASNTSLSNVAAQLQKAHLGSHPNLIVQSQAMPLRSPSSKYLNKYSNERLARFLAARTDMDGARTCTPCRTPLPHEIPGREVRRASDPVRTLDPNFSALKRLQRFHSLNMMKPLPVPQTMKSLLNKAGSNNTFHSSRSSIATDYSLHEDQEFGSPGDVNDSLAMETDPEAALEEKMLEDNEDMIIPDDMRRFLNERYGGLLTAEAVPDMMEMLQARSMNQTYMQNSQNEGTGQINNNNNNQYANEPSLPQNMGGMQGPHDYYGNQGMMYPDNHHFNQGAQNMGQNMSQNSPNMPPNAPNMSNMPPNSQNMPANMPPNAQNMPSNTQNMPPSMQHMQMWNRGQNYNNAGQCMPQASSQPLPQESNRGMNGMSPAAPVMPVAQTNQMANMAAQNNQWQAMANMQQNGAMPPPPHPPTHPQQKPMMPRPPPVPKNMRQMQPMGRPPHPPSQRKQERDSPQVQVPHISQSQIPPHAKAANRNQMLLRQQQQMMANQNMYQQGMYPPMGNMPPDYVQKMYEMQVNPMPPPTYPHPPNMNMPQPVLPQQQSPGQQQQHSTQNPPDPMMYNQRMNNMSGRPSCQINEQLPYSNLEMSPGCNQVTSSTDRTETTAPPIEQFMENLNSVSTENLIDNISSISSENLNANMYSPAPGSNRSISQTSSRYGAGSMVSANNMVVNDMSSVLTRLAEENKFLNMRH